MKVQAPLLLALGFVMAVGCSRADRGAVGTGTRGSHPAAAPTGQESAAARQEQKRLNGTWRVVAIEAGGQKVPDERIAGLHLTYVFAEDTLTVRRPDRPDSRKTYRLNPSASPKQIDLLAPGMPPTKGIYEVSGDRLRLCLNTDPRAPAQYPAEFISRASPTTDLLTLQREKP